MNLIYVILSLSFFCSISSGLDCSQVRGLVKKCKGNESYNVALTFDDGPKAPNTAKVLDTLKEKKVPGAMFFMTGTSLKLNPDYSARMLSRMQKEGHIIATHSMTHRSLFTKRLCRGKDISDELAKPLALIRELNSEYSAKYGEFSPSPFFRLPYGDGNFFLKRRCRNWRESKKKLSAELKKQKLVNMHWDHDSNDWTRPSLKRMLLLGVRSERGLLNDICRLKGGMSLFHDIQNSTVSRLGKVIDAIRCSGHKLVSGYQILKEKQDLALSGGPKTPLIHFAGSTLPRLCGWNQKNQEFVKCGAVLSAEADRTVNSALSPKSYVSSVAEVDKTSIFVAGYIAPQFELREAFLVKYQVRLKKLVKELVGLPMGEEVVLMLANKQGLFVLQQNMTQHSPDLYASFLPKGKKKWQKLGKYFCQVFSEVSFSKKQATINCQTSDGYKHAKSTVVIDLKKHMSVPSQVVKKFTNQLGNSNWQTQVINQSQGQQFVIKSLKSGVVLKQSSEDIGRVKQ